MLEHSLRERGDAEPGNSMAQRWWERNIGKPVFFGLLVGMVVPITVGIVLALATGGSWVSGLLCFALSLITLPLGILTGATVGLRTRPPEDTKVSIVTPTDIPTNEIGPTLTAGSS